MAKIVLIEDDQFVREDVLKLLHLEGFEVYGFENGLDGIKGIKKHKPDLVLCDIMLPDLDGHGVLQNLRESVFLASTPFIFLTAKAEMRDLRAGMQEGADDYITKPFDPEDLIASINTRLKRKEDTLESVKTVRVNATDEKNLSLENYIFVHGKEEYYPVKIGDIELITAEDVYSILHTIQGKSILIKRKMREWEDILPAKFFMRIHKSTIINIAEIEKIEKYFNRSFKVKMKHYKEGLTISKRFAVKNKIQELLIN